MIKPSQYLLTSSRDYAIYVCEHRAIPHAGDGLKHGQRMALWVLRNRAEKLKTIALSGLLAYEKLYVHGDVSCNNAIGFLAAPFKNNIPLIDGLGEFGSRVSPDAIGAPRYTECRRSKAAQTFLYNDLDIVPLEDNYDGSNKQPRNFLPLLPIVLLNGVSGIAVGWSTNILPRSLKCLIDATKQALSDQPIKTVPPHYDRYNITVSRIGDNQWEFTGHAKIVDTSTIQITELPPGLNIETFRRRLIEMEDADQIQSYTDRSTETINIAVKMKRGSVAQWKEATAIEFFKLTERTTERIVVVDWHGAAIRTYSNAELLIKDFVTWRLGWYTTRFQYLRRRDARELLYWQALKILFDNEFPKRLGSFPDRAALEVDVVTTIKIAIDDDQRDRIVNLPTYRWTHAFRDEVIEKIANIGRDIEHYDNVLGDPSKLRQIYSDELDALRNHKFSHT